MSEIIKEQDATDPEVQALIRRNSKVAKEAMALIAKRHRRLPPEKCFEAVANTIGILCTEIILDAESIAGPKLSTAIRELLHHHTKRADEVLKASRAQQPDQGPN